MTGRYSVEVVAIVKCGVGLHVQEIITVGGPDLLILFPKVCSNILERMTVRDVAKS